MDEEEFGCVGLEGVTTAGMFRAVDQHSGGVVPQTMPAVLRALDLMRRDRDALLEKIQGVQTETENVRGLLLLATQSAYANGRELTHALAARDYAENQCAALDEELQAARCRIEELETP